MVSVNSGDSAALTGHWKTTKHLQTWTVGFRTENNAKIMENYYTLIKCVSSQCSRWVHWFIWRFFFINKVELAVKSPSQTGTGWEDDTRMKNYQKCLLCGIAQILYGWPLHKNQQALCSYSADIPHKYKW